jgi:hypothetical protein
VPSAKSKVKALPQVARQGDAVAILLVKLRACVSTTNRCASDSARGKLAEPAFPPLLVPPLGITFFVSQIKKAFLQMKRTG